MPTASALQGLSTDILAQSFEAKYQLSPYFKTMAFHSHDFYEIYMFLSGSVSYYIENAGYTLHPCMNAATSGSGGTPSVLCRTPTARLSRFWRPAPAPIIT